jgi:hypothetical protein
MPDIGTLTAETLGKLKPELTLTANEMAIILDGSTHAGSTIAEKASSTLQREILRLQERFPAVGGSAAAAMVQQPVPQQTALEPAPTSSRASAGALAVAADAELAALHSRALSGSGGPAPVAALKPNVNQQQMAISNAVSSSKAAHAKNPRANSAPLALVSSAAEGPQQCRCSTVFFAWPFLWVHCDLTYRLFLNSGSCRCWLTCSLGMGQSGADVLLEHGAVRS